MTQPVTEETLNSPSELQSFLDGCLSTDRAALQNPPANFSSIISRCQWTEWMASGTNSPTTPAHGGAVGIQPAPGEKHTK